MRVSAGLVCLLAAAAAVAQESDIPIGAEQSALLREFERFEDNLLKAAEQARRDDPDRVDLLNRARGVSGERRILLELKRLSTMLNEKEPAYGTASEQQQQVVSSLEVLLKLLQTEDQREKLDAEREFFEQLLKETDRLIAAERDIRADTGRGKDSKKLQKEQGEIAEDAEELARRMDDRAEQEAGEKSEGEQSEGQKDDGQEQDGEKSEGQMSDSEKQDGEKQNPSERKDGEKSDGKKDAEPKDGEQSDGENSDSEQDGKPKDGEQSKQSPQDGQKQDSQQDQQSQQQDGQQQQSQQRQNQQQDSPQQQDQKPQPGREELEKARDQMKEAIEQLQKEAREEAGEAQDKALQELEKLKAELEKILRQLREEEDVIRLTLLEARFQQMLQAQLRINAATLRLDKTPEDERTGPFLTSATQLSRDEAEIITEADKALRLLREEGSSAAFPEAVEQTKSSMKQVARRLDDADVGKTTQVIEQMVVDSLEQLVVALQKDLDKKKQDQQQQQDGQQQQMSEQERRLVDQLAELKLIRSLQAQVKQMTEQFDASIDGRDPTDADREFIQDLARRQERIERITYELATQRTD